MAQINENLPFIHGDGVLPVDDIDLAVEIAEPVPVAPEVRIDDESAAVGESSRRWCPTVPRSNSESARCRRR